MPITPWLVRLPRSILADSVGASMPENETELITVRLSLSQIISAVRNMEKAKRESFLEDLLAAVSPEYLESIREARADYKAGRVYSHEEVFG